MGPTGGILCPPQGRRLRPGQTGRFRVRWFSRRPAKTGGFATKHRGIWYAVWNGGKQLVFQSAQRRLAITDALTCETSASGAVRTFIVRDDKMELFRLTYEGPAGEQDPTFDEIDLEQSDFFVWVARLWNDHSRRQAVIEGWYPAGPHAGAPQE
jgi:hypothetical protein